MRRLIFDDFIDWLFDQKVDAELCKGAADDVLAITGDLKKYLR